MKNTITVTLNTEKLRQEYWLKYEAKYLARAKKEKRFEENGGDFQDEVFRILSDKYHEASLQLSHLYRFLNEFIISDKIEIKRGQMVLEHDGFIYNIIRDGVHTSLKSNHPDAPLDGVNHQTKSGLIHNINWRIHFNHVQSIIKKQS